MENESSPDFLSKALQLVSGVFTIGALISQYFLREEFEQLLAIAPDFNYYKAFTLAGMIIGFLIVVMVFTNRIYSYNKWYPIKKAYTNYIISLKSERPEDRKSEPFYINLNRLAILSVFLSIISFIYIFRTENSLLKSIYYLSFLLLTVFSMSVFLTDLYGREEWRKNKVSAKQKIDTKIKEHFAPNYKVLLRYEDLSQLPQSTKLLIEVENKNYWVISENNDPDKFFSIQQTKDTEKTPLKK